EEGIVLRSNAEARIQAAWDVLQEKMVKRKVSLKSLDAEDPKPVGGQKFRMLVKLKEGIDTDRAKQIGKAIKDAKVRGRAGIERALVRTSARKRDALPGVIALLGARDYGLALPSLACRGSSPRVGAQRARERARAAPRIARSAAASRACSAR